MPQKSAAGGKPLAKLACDQITSDIPAETEPRIAAEVHLFMPLLFFISVVWKIDLLDHVGCETISRIVALWKLD